MVLGAGDSGVPNPPPGLTYLQIPTSGGKCTSNSSHFTLLQRESRGQRGGLWAKSSSGPKSQSESTGKVSTIMLREEKRRGGAGWLLSGHSLGQQGSKPSGPSSQVCSHSTKEGKHPVLLQLLGTSLILELRQVGWLLWPGLAKLPLCSFSASPLRWGGAALEGLPCLTLSQPPTLAQKALLLQVDVVTPTSSCPKPSTLKEGAWSLERRLIHWSRPWPIL